MTTFTVTNLNDNENDSGSLRYAIKQANAQAGADTIIFDPIFFTTPRTIALSAQLIVNDSLTIKGPGVNNLTISGDANKNGSSDSGDVRLFFVNQGSVNFNNLTLANGRGKGGDGGGGGGGMGGALFINDGAVTINNVTFSNNQAVGGGSITSGQIGGGGFGGNGNGSGYGGGGGGSFGRFGSKFGSFGGIGVGNGGGGFSGNGNDSDGGSGTGTIFGGNPAGNGGGGFGSGVGGGAGGGVGGGGGGGGFGKIPGNGGVGSIGGGGGGGGFSLHNFGGFGGNGGDFGGGGGGGGSGFGGGIGGSGGFGGGGGLGGSGFGDSTFNFGGSGGGGGFGGGGGGGGYSVYGLGGIPGSGGSFGGNGGGGNTKQFNDSGLGGGGAGLGAAIFIRSGSLTLVNGKFLNNTATGGLGGMVFRSSNGKSGANGQGKGAAIFAVTPDLASAAGVAVAPTVTAINMLPIFKSNSAANAAGTATDGNDVFGNINVKIPIANQPPVAEDDSAVAHANTPVKINVLSNDIDPDGDPLTLNVLANPTKGTAVVNNNGTPNNPNDDFITYNPAANFNGDSFTYRVSDGKANSNIATVNVLSDGVTYLVKNTNDSGAGSLRQAMLNANAHPGSDTIQFQIATYFYLQIPGAQDPIAIPIAFTNPQTINLTSPLPTITDTVTIDGWSQGGLGFQGAPRIELNGAASNSPTGLDIQASYSVIRGLAINSFPSQLLKGAAGIKLSNGATKNSIYGNYIGTDLTGNLDRGNAGDGILIEPSAGIENLIGTNGDGFNDAVEGNVISSNRGNGIAINGNFNAIDNKLTTVAGNFIGTNAAGVAALGNKLTGISVINAGSNTIGGINPSQRNLISGNTTDGVLISGKTATGNTLLGNYIGTQADGVSALGNLGNGVSIQNFATNNAIGGINTGNGNAIAYNKLAGIAINSGTGNAISNNAIFNNTGLGIDLGNDGVTPNDLNDADTGANNLQNFPVLTFANPSGNSTIVKGTLNSTANQKFRLEFFSNPILDLTGFGEGKTLLGSTIVTTDSSGNNSFTYAYASALPIGQLITATASDSANNTSEFSPGFAVNRLPVAVDDNLTVDPKKPVNINVLSNDTDPDGDPLTLSIVTNPENGTAVVNQNNTPDNPKDDFITYTNLNFNVKDSFSYQVSDGKGGTATANVNLTFAPSIEFAIPDPKNSLIPFTGTLPIPSPVISPTPTPFPVISPTPTPFPVISPTPTPSLVIPPTPTPSLVIPPTPTPSLVIPPAANKSPIAIGDTAIVNANTSVDINVLSNDSDPDGDPLNLSIFNPPASGKVVVNNNGTPKNPNDDFITYTPNPNFSGKDVFSYQIKDGKGGSADTKVELTVKAVKAVNKLPIAIDDSATTDQVTPVNIKVLANDSDPDGDPLILTVLTNGVGGKAEINDNGTVDKTDDFITYQPNGKFTGPDSFTYQIDDGHGGTAKATVKLTVNSVNKLPIAIDDSAVVNQDSTVAIDVLSNDSDPDGNPLTLSIGTNPLHGKALVRNGISGTAIGGAIVYTPDPKFSGKDALTYQISDGQGGTATANVNLTVNPTISPPIAPLLLNGTPNADTLVGAEGNDTINGNAGDDLIDALGGNDLINGGIGNLDRIFGSAGDDTITDPDGVNDVEGGVGNDSINITFAETWDNNTNPNDAPSSDNKIIGGIGNDTITVTMNYSSFLIGIKGDELASSNSDGNDLINLLGNYANSVVDMGGGDDIFNGGLGNDSVSGGDGNDTLIGGDGNNTLIGGDGNDQLAGNAGNDFLTGDAGQDQFLFTSKTAFNTADFGSDRITDFTIGTDKILLSQTAFGTITSAQIAFVDSDLAAETSNGLIVYSRTTGNLFFNQNGVQTGLGTGALFAKFDGTPSLTVTDFQIVI